MAIDRRPPVTLRSLHLFPLVVLGLVLMPLSGCTGHRDADETPPMMPLVSSMTTTAAVCTDILVFGVAVEVRDARTGLPAAFGARGEIRDGEYREALKILNPFPDPSALYLSGAAERPGTYDVTVRKPGYERFRASGVRVVMDDAGCHVVPVRLLANLAPRR